MVGATHGFSRTANTPSTGAPGVVAGMGSAGQGNLTLLEVILAIAILGGALAVIGELGMQYDGIPVDSPKLEALWKAAEAADVPVAIHMGPGPPGVAYFPGSGYNLRPFAPGPEDSPLEKRAEQRAEQAAHRVEQTRF